MAVIAIVYSSYAQNRPTVPDAGTVMAMTLKTFEDVKDFTVAVDAEINMDRVQVPKMHAIMYFKRPDRIHFASTGFLLVPRDGLALNPAVLSERYDASMMGTEKDGKRKLYKLQLAAKDSRTKLRQMYCWIDGSNWTIAKIETIPYEGRTLSVDFTYGLVDGKFWLPSRVIAAFGSTGEGGKNTDDSLSRTENQLSQTQPSGPRNGSITFIYSGYSVNTGIDDSVFDGMKQGSDRSGIR
jgi:hypothetical protein